LGLDFLALFKKFGIVAVLLFEIVPVAKEHGFVRDVLVRI